MPELILIFLFVSVIVAAGYGVLWLVCWAVSTIEKEELIMCDICGQAPHDPRCPYAPEPEVAYQCAKCGAAICEGDTCYEIAYNEYWCDECIDGAMKTAEVGCYG